MKVGIEINAPFAFCSLCDCMMMEQAAIFGDNRLARYQCKYSYICENAVNMYKTINEKKDDGGNNNGNG